MLGATAIELSTLSTSPSGDPSTRCLIANDGGSKADPKSGDYVAHPWWSSSWRAHRLKADLAGLTETSG
jgi:hypothetical protein